MSRAGATRRPSPSAAPGPAAAGPARWDWAVPTALCLCVAALYAPVRGYPFVVLDDYGWIVENPLVNRGLSWDAIVAAFTQSVLGNWVPVTWLSHLLDISLFGMDAGPHHVVNVLIHAAASVALFAALRRMTADVAPSAFVALVFAIHPLHVESVAWISERRDVLSGLFFALSLLAWARYAQRGARSSFVASAAAFAAGLLAKPMLVTLPVVLLLLDCWPLARTGLGLRRLLLEKLPFAGIAGLVAVATLASQGDAGAVVGLDLLPLTTRAANALTSTVAYVATSVWPTPLAVFYPYPDAISPWKTLAAAAGLAAVTAGALRVARQRPWLAVGWLWFVVTLLPVIGLVQVGSQARADRYMYLPLVGLVIAAAFTGAELTRRGPRWRAGVLALCALWLVACAALARGQVAIWRDSVTLFEHARAVSGDHPIILVNLGEAYELTGDADRAIAHYQAGLVGYAHAPRVRTRLGALLAERGRLTDAAMQLEQALRRHPAEPRTRLEIGRLLLRDGQPEAAAELLAEEDERFPGSAVTRFHLAEARAGAGQREAAVALFAEAWRAEPELSDTPLLDHARVADALAEAQADRGRPARALHWTRRGLLLARLAGDDELADRLRASLPEREAAARTAGEGRR